MGATVEGAATHPNCEQTAMAAPSVSSWEKPPAYMREELASLARRLASPVLHCECNRVGAGEEGGGGLAPFRFQAH